MTMRVSELWRFPVKSLCGEQLSTATLTEDGVAGDRLVHVQSDYGVVTARSRSALLGLSATTAPDGQVLVNGLPWQDPRVADLVRAAVRADVALVPYQGPERFDVLNLLVATDGSIEAFGYDSRRLRPNIVISGVAGLAERGWPGTALRVGDAVIGVYSVRSRCVITTIDPDTGERDLDVLRKIQREFDLKLALNCWVAAPGVIRVGDEVELVELELVKPEPKGWIIGAPYTLTRTRGDVYR